MRTISIKNETGIGRDTQIKDIESGKIIHGITEANLYLGATGLTRATLMLIMPEIDISEAEASFILECPHCKKKVIIR